jgi:invasion protein IalB
MHNDTDERRRYDQNNRRQRYQAPAEDQDEQYERGDEYEAHGEYNAGEPRYAEHGDHDGHSDYEQQQDAPLYDEAPRRRSLVPILMIVAAVLVVAIGVGAALYFLGVFGGSQPPVATAAAPTTTDQPALTDAPPLPAAEGIRSVGPTVDAPATTLTPGGATAENPSIPDAVVSIAPPAQGEPPVRSVHDAWQVRCDTPAGAQAEQCVLMQFVTAEDRENVGLTVIVLKTADQKARIMRILAPLGVLLPSGLGLKIDEADIGRAGFVRCLPNGCVAEVILEDQLLDQLEAGATATFIIFQTPEEGIGIPISLAGFGDGFSALP